MQVTIMPTKQINSVGLKEECYRIYMSHIEQNREN